MKRINLTDLSVVNTMNNAEMAEVNGGGILDKLKTINRVRTLGCTAVKALYPSLAKTKIFKVLCFLA